MNGDVGKQPCGDFCPISVSCDDHNTVPDSEVKCTQFGIGGSELVDPEMNPNVGTAAENMENDQGEASSADAGISDPDNAVGHTALQDPSNDKTISETTESDIVTDSNEQRQEEVSGCDDIRQASDHTPKDEAQFVETAPPTGPQSSARDGKALTREQIKELVSQQVEYFFSRENWSSDRYLVSQMDSDQYVPIYILANCSQFKSITKDHSIILEALKESLFVQLDEGNNRVRPNYKRCIVILREIPESTPVKDIEAMFEGEGCPKAISCEFVHNDFWYVTFESDSDAQKAYRYLRETVKTFNNKPILARIKTKPMSRFGCLSVLPSYGGKPAGEPRENSIPPPPGVGPNPAPCITPVGPSGIPGIPNPPPPPAYPPGSTPRVYFPQNSMNPTYNYNYGGSPQVPTAYFYPNPMMQWSQPSFYDINSFIQYNGLSPRATYKPPSNSRYSNNNNNNNNNSNNRRNKIRENKYDKNDARHLSNGSSSAGPSRNSAPISRPQSAHSPHPTNSNLGLHSMNSHHSYPSHPPPSGDNVSQSFKSSSSGCSTPNNIGVPSVPASFAQSDCNHPSHADMYTTYDAVTAGPSVTGSTKVERKDKTDIVSNPAHSLSSTINVQGVKLVESASSISQAVTTNCSYSSHPESNTLCSYTPSSNQNSGSGHTAYSSSSHHHPISSAPRNFYSYEGHGSSRDPQPQRQISRGGRRRLSRRDEESNGHSGSGINGRGSQRGMGPNQDSHSKASHTESRKPQFELQSNLFPPLPCTDEVTACIPEEKMPEPPSKIAWSGDVHKFSDVMKGTAKPKQINSSAPADKDSISLDTLSLQTLASVSESDSSKTMQYSSSCLASQSVSGSQDVVPTSASGSTSSIKCSVSSDIHSTGSGTQTQILRHDRTGAQIRDQRAGREERRGAAATCVRREREFVAGIGRGVSRRESTNFRMSGTKENRPHNRYSKEESADSEGWITKTPREARNNRDHRYQTTQQHSYCESKNNNSTKVVSAMVNGDSSPPASPKPEVEAKSEVICSVTNAKVVTNNTKNTATSSIEKPMTDATMKDKETIVLNNNDGEHKTSYAKMALASKDEMERLSAELKEKEEQERLKKIRTTRPPAKVLERVVAGRERDGKSYRRENLTLKDRDKDAIDRTREFRGPENRNTVGFKQRDSIRPKSPK